MKVRLRSLCLADAPTSLVWRNDPDVWTYTHAAGRAGPRLEDEVEWIHRAIGDQTCRRFAITADERYVGNVYLTDIADGSAEFHIFIGDKAFWGRGVARAATRQILNVGFCELKLDRINLGVHLENAAARHLYHSLGFVIDRQDGPFTRMSLVRPVFLTLISRE